MHELSGGCRCANVSVRVELGLPPAHCHPRVCDCDFCVGFGSAYLSDPEGSLTIHIKDASKIEQVRQGNKIAEFLLCRACGVLVAALYEESGRSFGVVNARVLGDRETFGAEVPVSPKQLGTEERTARWKRLWFSRVSVATGGG